MLVNISEGEIFDKLTILEIKLSEIKESNKLKEIQNEINILSQIDNIKEKFIIYYNTLYYINKKIWDMTNIVKQMEYTNSSYSKLMYDIFELNQQRFRIKNIINNICNSNIKEQKSYKKLSINVLIPQSTVDKHIIMKLLYLSMLYDEITIYTIINGIEMVLPNINVNNNIDTDNNTISLDNITIPDDININI